MRPNYYKVTIQKPEGNVEIECIDVMNALGLIHNFNLANSFKYLWRAGRKTKSTTEDIKKARTYLDLELERLEMENANLENTPQEKA